MNIERRIGSLKGGGGRRKGGTAYECREVQRYMRSCNWRMTSFSFRLAVMLLLAFACRSGGAGWIDPDTEDEHKSTSSLHNGRVYELVSRRGGICALSVSRRCRQQSNNQCRKAEKAKG